MKKYLLAVLTLVVLAAAGYCLYMETHFSMTTLEDSGLSEEKILREMPEIALSDRDLAMGGALLAAPEVQEAFLQADGTGEVRYVVIPAETASGLLSDWTPEGFAIWELGLTSQESLHVSFRKEGEQTVYYTFFADDSCPPQKVIGIYGRTLFQEDACKAIYQNLNGEITKLKEQHIWFYWLTGER